MFLFLRDFPVPSDEDDLESLVSTSIKTHLEGFITSDSFSKLVTDLVNKSLNSFLQSNALSKAISQRIKNCLKEFASSLADQQHPLFDQTKSSIIDLVDEKFKTFLLSSPKSHKNYK
ncbi:hypothetical protein CROQUDRAFT_101432 [Cronartium quercuum f. sp. fusiforme G11]|uniref:Uncharacterized protein n=1 Tax=Cronartium quercuum f. sp. fusiforme G11 TaxID=708437 RepID=A0A9P6T5G5_9BASI|nr:hypothetical protein CROQUDRAFT_101432 [Cronartium quercuum f. sp. fusiforme G11]